MSNLYKLPETMPWLDPIRQGIETTIEHDRLAHALLIHGAGGSGKTVFAAWIAARLLSRYPAFAELEQSDALSATAATLAEHASHPDLMIVSPPEDKKTISVDQIRSLTERLQLTSLTGAGRVAILNPCEQMTVNAANSLLKTLEEPPPGAYLILVTGNPSHLPITVLSRCQRLSLPRPPIDLALNWLSAHGEEDWETALVLAGGAPLGAWRLSKTGDISGFEQLRKDLVALQRQRSDVITIASRWLKRGPEHCLDWLAGLIEQMIRNHYGAGPAPKMRLADLQKSYPCLTIDRLFDYLDEVRETRALLQTSANPQLSVETALIPWMTGFSISH